MKKLLIVLLFLGNSSAFASYCLIVTQKIDNDLSRFHSKFSESRFVKISNIPSRFGVRKQSIKVSTGEKNAFGEAISQVEEKFELYDEGKVIYSTGFFPRSYQNSRIHKDMIVLELQKLGCD